MYSVAEVLGVLFIAGAAVQNFDRVLKAKFLLMNQFGVEEFVAVSFDMAELVQE